MLRVVSKILFFGGFESCRMRWGKAGQKMGSWGGKRPVCLPRSYRNIVLPRLHPNLQPIHQLAAQPGRGQHGDHAQ
jgi:hypothetical protein